jgi:hypothetical protein
MVSLMRRQGQRGGSWFCVGVEGPSVDRLSSSSPSSVIAWAIE